MVRSLLSRIFSSRIFYIAFSLIVAFSLWLYVEISFLEDAHTTIEAAVQIIGEDILRDRDLFISAYAPESVSVTFDGARSAITILNREDIVVEVDVSKITTTGPTSIEHVIKYPDNFDQGLITRVSFLTNRITLNVDRLTSRQVLVDAQYNGGAAFDDLVIDPLVVDPAVITVNGPEDILSRISVAYVEIIRENLTSTYIDDFSFILLDEDRQPFPPELYEQLTFNNSTVRVTVPIRMIREIPLEVEFFHGAGSSSENIDYYIEPMSIVLTGDPDAFHGLSNIMLGTIDTTRFGLRTSTPEVFNIIVPGNLENVSGFVQANVFVEVLGLRTDTYSVANINAINAPIIYDVEILNERMLIRVRGTNEDLEYLSERIGAGGLNIRVEVDVEGLEPGVHRISPPNVRIYIDGVDRDVGAVGAATDYIVTVRIR